MVRRPWSVGSRWLRWDPHLHAPGTLRNDQFGGDWDGYLRRIEEADPPPFALGITDYFTLASYKEVLARRKAGALSAVPLVFANIEIRLTIETRDRQGINLHLLISPEDPEHVARMEENLARLRFQFRDQPFPCTDDGLRRLGRTYRNDQSLSDRAALAEGANQFKVALSDLRDLQNDDAWVRANVLFAVAAGNDGLSGISRDASFGAQREELGRFADIVLSSNERDRAYWLGQHADFRANGQTPKPCLHGSDAHTLDGVLMPDGMRRCWIRAEPTFDGLRQTLVEPGRRVHVGEAAPEGPGASSVIRSLRVRGAAWFGVNGVELNDGLVTVIGAKGSGKTALADLLAAAADADDEQPGPASFVAKAGDLLAGVEIEIEWSDGMRHSTTLPRSEWDDRGDARVRYLSQQFVERLCSGTGLGNSLVDELERVVFDAIPEEDRLQCSTFSELRDATLEGHVADGDAERDAIRAATRLVADETRLQRNLPTLRTAAADALRARMALEKQIAAIPLKADDSKIKAHEGVTTTLKVLKDAIAAQERRAQGYRDLAADVQRHTRAAEIALDGWKAKFDGLLDVADWDRLRLRVDDQASEMLTKAEASARSVAADLRAHGLVDSANSASTDAANTLGLAALTAEAERLGKELGLDQANAVRRNDLLKRLVIAKEKEEKAKRDVAHAEKAQERIKSAQATRVARYEALFESLVAQEGALRTLYAPLSRRIETDERLSKLSFVVERVVDLEQWAGRGELLLDLRKPPFPGRGLLANTARKVLLPSWRRGSPKEASEAMRAFLGEHATKALEALTHGTTPHELGEWLFSTDHIQVRYGVQYEGVDIAHLSPGTRGVVLLTLYLALDQWDRRPLIIDQPEENLDPRSVYADLVPFFRDAARRRQIVMVTHNANLVVNTDSDQVIVAQAQRRAATELPTVTYSAGGLEDPGVREEVCRLLEGGREAFAKRSQRYGVRS